MYFKRIILFILLTMALEFYVVTEILEWTDRSVIYLFAVHFSLAIPGLLYGIYSFITGR